MSSVEVLCTCAPADRSITFKGACVSCALRELSVLKIENAALKDTIKKLNTEVQDWTVIAREEKKPDDEPLYVAVAKILSDDIYMDCKNIIGDMKVKDMPLIETDRVKILMKISNTFEDCDIDQSDILRKLSILFSTNSKNVQKMVYDEVTDECFTVSENMINLMNDYSQSIFSDLSIIHIGSFNFALSMLHCAFPRGNPISSENVKLLEEFVYSLELKRCEHKDAQEAKRAIL
jgi:hypothetical protein